jgi:hypothetical protein
MKCILLVTFLFVSFPLFGDNSFRTFKMECRRLSPIDFERSHPRTGHCFERKYNAKPLAKASSRPIKINFEKTATYRIENDETISYYPSTFPDYNLYLWTQIISHRSPHQEITFFRACQDDGIYYGVSTLDEGGWVLKENEILAPYFIECIIL